ncbi:MAG: hypothetical protein WD768_05725 [Phycisphaeraceae bacterium]
MAEASSSFDTGPAVDVVRQFIDAASRKDEEAMKACMCRKTLEGGQFHASGPTIDRYELGEVTTEGEIVIVPAAMKAKDVPEGQPEEMTMPFVVVPEDGAWKIDMSATVERLMGFSMDDMMEQVGDAMKGAVEGLAEGMKQAFDGMGEALSEGMGQAMSEGMGKGIGEGIGADSDNEQPAIGSDSIPGEESDSPEFENAKAAFAEAAPDEIAKINNVLGKEINVVVDWPTFGGDWDAAGKLGRRGLDTVRSAICLLSSETELLALLAPQLNAVRFRFVYYPEDKSCVLENGALEIALNPSHADGVFEFGEIQRAIREGVDMERGPALAHLINEFMPELNKGVKSATRVKVDHQVIVATFMDMPDRTAAVQAMADLEHVALLNWIPIMAQVHEKVALYDRVWTVHFEHVPHAWQRVVFADGNLLVYRVNLTEGDGYYYSDELEQILTGVIAGMPVSESPFRDDIVPPADLPAESLVSYYVQNFAPRIAGRISEVLGKNIEYDGDWPEFAADAASARGLTIWSMHRVLGAVALWCGDEKQKAALEAALDGIMIRYVSSPQEKALAFAGGTLSLSIHPGAGEAGAFYEHEIAGLFKSSLNLEADQYTSDARQEAETWQKQMLEEVKVPIRFEIDYAGFLGNPETAGFGRHILREHGIDAIFYALMRIARAEGDKRRPNLEKRAKVFVEHLQRRVRTLRLTPVSTPEGKIVTADPSEPGVIEYRLYTDKGYDGYLTIDDLEDELPDLVAKLPDLPDWEDDVVKPEPVAEEPADEGEDDDDDDDDDDSSSDMSAENFRMAVESVSQAIPSYEQALTGMMGHPVSVTLDFESLGGDFEMITLLMTHGFTPVWEALATMAFDAELGERAKAAIQRVVIGKSPEGTEGQILLNAGTLVFISPMHETYKPLSGAEVTELLKKLLMATPGE